MLRRYGEAATREFFGAQLDAVSYVADFISNHAIDTERSGNGEFQLAHRRWALDALEAERDLLAAVFGFRTELLKRAELAERGVGGPEFHGGLWSPVGFGLHPLRYLRSLAGLADQCRSGHSSLFSGDRLAAGRRRACSVDRRRRGASEAGAARHQCL